MKKHILSLIAVAQILMGNVNMLIGQETTQGRSSESRLKLSVSFVSAELNNFGKKNVLPLAISITNISKMEVTIIDRSAWRGVNLYILGNDGKRTKIFPWDARNGEADSGMIEGRRFIKIAPGKTCVLEIQVPIALLATISSDRVVASITEINSSETPPNHEIFSEPFIFPVIKR